jgi:hypothetical protein
LPNWQGRTRGLLFSVLKLTDFSTQIHVIKMLCSRFARFMFFAGLMLSTASLTLSTAAVEASDL